MTWCSRHLRTALLAYAIEHGLAERAPAATGPPAKRCWMPSPPWRDRLELVRRVVLPRLPVLLLADNAEDLLTDGDDGDRELADQDLAGFTGRLASRLHLRLGLSGH